MVARMGESTWRARVREDSCPGEHPHAFLFLKLIFVCGKAVKEAAVAVAAAAGKSREDANQAGWDAAVAFREAEKVA